MLANLPATKQRINKFGFPEGAPVTSGVPSSPVVPWQYGAKQGFLTYRVRASQGIFTKVTAKTSGTTTQGTYDKSLFENGTVTNSVITGGTETNPVINTGTVNTSAFDNGTLGTCQITGGTVGTALIAGGTSNQAAYQTGGTAGVSGSIVYVKTVNFAGSTTTLGTLQFLNGLIVSAS